MVAFASTVETTSSVKNRNRSRYWTARALRGAWLLLCLLPAGCGGSGGGGGAAAAPAVGGGVVNRAPLFNGGVTVTPTAIGSGGGTINFSVNVADPDNDALTVAAVLSNAATGQAANAAFLSLNNGVFTGTAAITPNGSAGDLVFNVTVQATDNKVTTPSTLNGPQVTVQGLVAPPPSPTLSRIR